MTLVDPGGNPVVLDREEKEFVAGGMRIRVQATPEDMLQRALAGAQKMTAQQVGMMVMQRTGNKATAEAEATTAASKVRDPFTMEPAALAIFMFLAREIEYRDRVIADMATRLDRLDNHETNLEHPYPSAPIPESSDDEDRKSSGEAN